MKKIIFPLVFLIIVLGVLVFRKEEEEKDTKAETKTEQITPARNVTKYKTIENSEAEITIAVTPVSLSGQSNVRFSISYNTHSIGLDKNLKDISFLIDDKGNKYQAIGWDGAEGHHVNGILTFPKISALAKSVKLIIKGIGGVDRSFEWNI